MFVSRLSPRIMRVHSYRHNCCNNYKNFFFLLSPYKINQSRKYGIPFNKILLHFQIIPLTFINITEKRVIILWSSAYMAFGFQIYNSSLFNIFTPLIFTLWDHFHFTLRLHKWIIAIKLISTFNKNIFCILFLSEHRIMFY